MDRAARQARWVLVVGNQVGPRTRIEDRLRAAGYQVSGFATVENTLLQLRTGPAPDLVLLDVPSPIEDAFRKAQKADPALADIKVLALFTVDPPRLIEKVDALFPSPSRLDLADPLAFLTANLTRMGQQLPDLIANAQKFSALIDRSDQNARSGGDSDDKIQNGDDKNKNSDDEPPSGEVQSPRAVELAQLIEKARRGGERIASYVPYLNAFGPAAEKQRGPIDVARVLDFVIGISMSEIRERAQLIKRFEKTPLVFAGEKQLGQVFSSLIINAAESIPYGRSDENRVQVLTSTGELGACVIEIEDSGSGIAPDVLPHIFEPFYSTKRGAGMGLGLFICHTTITGLGGVISVDSRLGEGTTFRIELPPMGNIAAAG